MKTTIQQITRKSIALLIACLFVMSSIQITSVSAIADDEIPTYEENGIIYEIYDDYAQVAGYTGTPTDVIIPKIVNGLNVTRVKGSAFKDCTSITSVVLPEGMEYVGGSAFYGCTALVSASLPDSITTLGSSAFYGCRALETVNLPTGITEISGDLFRSCSSLRQITIPDNVTYISSYAFSSAGLTSIEIPEGVRSIGLYTFQYCNSLESVTFPDSLTYIGDAAFQYCHKLKKAVVPANVTNVYTGAFYYNDALESIELRGKLKQLYNVTFDLCSTLTEVIVPEGVNSIGWHTFRSNTALKKIYIPDSVTSIDREAFTNTTNYKAYVHRGSYADSFFTSSKKVYIDEEDYFAQKTDWLFGKAAEITVGIDDELTVQDLFLFGTSTDLTDLEVSSSDENVIMLTDEGFMLIDYGTSVITASCADKSAQVTVRVEDAAGAITGEVSFAEASVTADVGDAVYQPLIFTDKISKDYMVTWTSSDTEVATVDINGIVHGVAEGTAEITAHCGSYTATYEFQAIRSAKQVNIWDDDFTMDAGRITRLLYYTYPYNSPEQTEFISSDPSVATVDETGLITAVGAGVTVITLKKGDCVDTVTVTVEAKMTGISLDYSSLRLRIGKSVDLGFRTIPAVTTDPYEVSWSSSNTSVAVVNDGVVTGVGQGRATITVTAGEYSASCTVIVVNLTGVDISETSAELTEGETIALTAACRPVVTEGTEDYEITWSSSAPEIASVDSTGVVTAVSRGSAVITAQADQYEATCTVTVRCAHTGETERRGKLDPTCSEPGSTGDLYCLVCGELLEAGEELPALGHDYVETVTAPTCEEQGYTTYLCTRCGDTYVADYTDALGHDWDEGVVITEPTPEAPGVRRYTCSRCDETRDEEIELILNDIAEAELTLTSVVTKAKNGTYWVAYDGTEKEPAVSVQYGSDTLTEDTDYTVAYTDDIKVGTATVTVTGQGYYTGMQTITFRITFTDVPLTHSFQKAVYWAVDEGIGAGYTGAKLGLFGVGDEITRGQVAMFLWRAAGKPEPETNTQTFTDVPTSSNFYKAIQWAVEHSITGGYTGARAGQFGPSDNCTRGQIATFLWRYAGKPAPAGNTQTFTDVPTSSNFYKAIQWAVENGITGGYTGARTGQFGPSDTCTRGQCVTFLYRLLAQ